MFQLIGAFAVFGLFQLIFSSLGSQYEFYFDEVALLIVFGGTATVAVMSYPWRDVMTLFTGILQFPKSAEKDFKEDALKIVEIAKELKTSNAALKSAAEDLQNNEFLRDGLDLIISGLQQEEINSIMSERIYREKLEEEKRVHLLKGLAKYPPAFGLVGTVLGLVNLMRNIGDGSDTSLIGLKMALALIATLYGLVLANFFLVPLAEHFATKADIAKNHKEMLLEGLLMIYQKRSPLAIQEMMNSYLDKNKKIDVLGLKEVA